MVRRPLLEPNLSASGLTFTGISLLGVLDGQRDHQSAGAVGEPTGHAWIPAQPNPELAKHETPAWPNPGYALFYKLSGFSNQAIISADPSQPEAYSPDDTRVATTRSAAILAHLAVVAGMVWIGFRHFDNIHTGVAAATLYLLTFYTSQFTSQVDHVVPAMLLVWAVAAYRRPMLAGVLLGLAGGHDLLSVVPAAAVVRLLLAARAWSDSSSASIVAIGLLVASLALTSPDLASFADNVQLMFGWRNPLAAPPSGFWQFYDAGLSDSGVGGVRGHELRLGDLARPKESRHAAELLGGGDAGDASSGTPTKAGCTWPGICRC